MSDETLGLAIGTTNLTAVRPGREAVSRRAVLTLWEGHPAEIGVPSQNPALTSPNLISAAVVLRGFVERVGDPVPLVAQDGSPHRGDELTAIALESMARATPGGRPAGAVVVAVPAHWGPAAVGALRGALRTNPVLAPGGAVPLIVSDATAALAGLRSDPGLPGHGVVALCDFGAGGSSITLADAGADFAIIGQTARYAEFSGDRADEALLNRILAEVRAASPADTGSTAAVGSVMRLREECRLAKERLSTETTTAIPVDLPDYHSDVEVTRAELDDLLSEPFTGFLDVLGDVLERNGIPAARLSAVATVGGGAAIPFVRQRLSEQLRVPLITPAEPELTAARGAAVIAATGAGLQAPTGIAVTAADAPTSLAPSAWAVGAAGQAATESASDGSPSATFRALAWSQDDPAADEPVPYTGGDYHQPESVPGNDYTDYTGADYFPPTTAPSATSSGPTVRYGPGREDGTELVPAALPWYRRPPLLFGIAAVLAAMAVGGLAITLTTDSSPTTTTKRVTKPGEDPGGSESNPPAPQTVTVTGDNGQPTVTTITPTTTETSEPTTTSTTTTTTTTTPTTTTTTPTTTATTTPTTTTTTPTTTRTTTTTRPPTTTTAEPTTTVAPQPTTTVAPQPTTTAASAPTAVEPVLTADEIPVPTLTPAADE